MIDIHIDDDALDAIIIKLERTEDELKGGRVLWRNVIIRLKQAINEQFTQQAGFVGARQIGWPFYTSTFSSIGDAYKYMEWKDKNNPGTSHQLLVLTGRLKRSLVSHNKWSIRNMGDRFLQFGTRVPWAQWHNWEDNLGANNGWRPFLHANDKFENIAISEAVLHANRKVRRNFRG